MDDKEQLTNTPDTDISALYQLFEISVGPSPKSILLLGYDDDNIPKHFIENGYKVYTIKVSDQLKSFAKRNSIKNPLSIIIPHISYKNAFDGIWVYTSFVNIYETRIKEALARCNIALKKNGVIFISFKYKDINEETIKPYLHVSGFNILDSIITDEWFNVVLKKVAKPTYEVRNDQREIVCRRRMSRRTNKVKQTRSNLEYALITGNCLPTIRRSDRDVGLHKFGPYNPNPSDPDYRPPASINFLLTSEQKIIKDSNFVLDFYLFTDEFKSTINKMVNASLSTPIKEGMVDGIKNDCNISILLSSPDIPSINDEDTYKWSGTFHTSNLSGYVPKDYDRDSFIVIIDIVVDGVRISRIKSNININDNNPGQLIFNVNKQEVPHINYIIY